jgi:beta-mannanase
VYYPGDDYVDIVVLDVYVDNPVRSKNCFFLLIIKYQNKCLITLKKLSLVPPNGPQKVNLGAPR